MTQEFLKDEAFLEAVIGVGIPVVRSLYHDIINKIIDEKRRKQLKKKFDKLLPELPLGAKKIIIADKTFYMYFKEVTNSELSTYNMNRETIGKILKIVGITSDEASNFNYLVDDRNCTFSAPMNYNRVFMDKNKDFISELIDALPMDDIIRDIQFKIDDELGIYFVYQDGVNFGLTVDAI